MLIAEHIFARVFSKIGLSDYLYHKVIYVYSWTLRLIAKLYITAAAERIYAGAFR